MVVVILHVSCPLLWFGNGRSGVGNIPVWKPWCNAATPACNDHMIGTC